MERRWYLQSGKFHVNKRETILRKPSENEMGFLNLSIVYEKTGGPFVRYIEESQVISQTI